MKVLREGPLKITKTMIEAAWKRRSKDQRLVIGDAECRGLALVVNATGMAWRFDYKPRGVDPVTGKRFATRSITIGSPKTHSPDTARDAAFKAKGEAKAGGDPADTRRKAVADAAAKRARTVERLVDEYAKALPARPKLRGSGQVTERHVAYELTHLKAAIAAMKAGNKPVGDLGAPDLRTMLAAIGSKPATARHRFGALSRFFDWCQDEGHIAPNPCALLAKARRPRAVAARQHYLSTSDLALLWHAAGKSEDLTAVHRDLIRFLIAVPCRRGEAASLDWLHIDLAAAAWTQPGALTKNGDPHRVHLPPLALDILLARRRDAGEPKEGLVFPAPQSKKSVDTFSAMKATLAEAGPKDWRWHDFRRSFATALAVGEAARMMGVSVKDPPGGGPLERRGVAKQGLSRRPHS